MTLGIPKKQLIRVSFGALTLDLSDTSSLAEALAKISQYAADNPGRQWIIGNGWNQEAWGLGRFPTAAELDSVVADRPVFLSRVDGHAVWVNGAAMAAAGISSATKSPGGGNIEKSGGKPTGIFVDTAMDLFDAAIPSPKPVDRDVALSKAQDILLASGVTSIADMGTTMQDWQSFRRAGDKGQLKVRIISYAAEIENMIAIAGPGPSPWLYDDHLRLAGVKLYIDGALGSRGALLKKPYADKAGESGLAMLSSAQLKNKMSRAAMDGFQTAVHAIGDQANDDILSAIEELGYTYKGDRRWRVEHAQIVDPVDIGRFAATGTIASMQPVHQTSDRLMAEARLGTDRLVGAYAWQSLRWPCCCDDPRRRRRTAVRRVDAEGEAEPRASLECLYQRRRICRFRRRSPRQSGAREKGGLSDYRSGHPAGDTRTDSQCTGAADLDRRSASICPEQVGRG